MGGYVVPNFATNDFVPEKSRAIITYVEPGSKKSTRARVMYLGNEVIGSAVFMFFEAAQIKGRSTKVTRFGLNADTIKRIDPIEDDAPAPRRKKKRKAAAPEPPAKKTRKKKKKKVVKRTAAKKKKVRRRRRS
jgi:hypothetical protein